MKIFTSLAIALLSAKPVPRCEVYPTVAASDAWISRVKQLPQRKQLAALHQRLACDAHVRGRTYTIPVCVSCLTAEGRRAHQAAQEKQRLAEAADPRPPGIILFYLIDGRIVAPADTAQWQPLMSWQRVREIAFLESRQAEIIGGTRAQDGMVIITTKKP
ncbi:MAG: hypothetical protein EOO56_26730 [Hymenobacter sp.]|nr:MAG: hypothetical protein EOO56_26730 [Hymenobacter sp.]